MKSIIGTVILIVLITSCYKNNQVLVISPELENYADEYFQKMIVEELPSSKMWTKYISLHIRDFGKDSVVYSYTFFDGLYELVETKPLLCLKKDGYYLVVFSNLGSEIQIPESEIEKIFTEICPDEAESYKISKRTGRKLNLIPNMLYEGRSMDIVFVKGKFFRKYYLSGTGEEIQ
ncbi:MAG: hypothetical protein HOO86_01845 [Bacteroidales bacterium]|nr:hypothetical protein [Bacteroidales bacterium]